MKTKIKTISVLVSKKTPVPGEEYTTHSFSVGLEAGIEAETGCSDEDLDEYVDQQYRRLKERLQTKIDRWLEENGSNPSPDNSSKPDPQNSDLSGTDAKEEVTRALEKLEPEEPTTLASDKQIKYLKGLLDEHKIDREWVCHQCDTQNLDDLLKEEAWLIINTLAD